jgi:hypothetical protein
MAVMSAGLTHPTYASLGHPLFACGGKRVAAIYVFGSVTTCKLMAGLLTKVSIYIRDKQPKSVHSSVQK